MFCETLQIANKLIIIGFSAVTRFCQTWKHCLNHLVIVLEVMWVEAAGLALSSTLSSQGGRCA